MSRSPPEKYPPKPRLTLRVGITGHRPNKLKNGDMPRVAEQIREVMAAIDRVAATIHRENAEFYSNASPTDQPATQELYRIRLVSGFAEGADQMAVAAAPKDWTVEAILPFPREEYRKDFIKSSAGDGRDVTHEFDASLERAQVITELPAPPNPDRRNQGYVMAGGYLLRQVDVLIAVWDGEQPKPGGTGVIAQEAHDGGIPVIWISIGAAGDVQFIDKFDDEKPIPSHQPWGDATLKAALDPILAAPSDTDKVRRRSPRAGLQDFYKEKWHSACWAPVFDLLKRLTNGQWPRLVIRCEPYDALIARFNQLIDEAPNVEPLTNRLKDILAPRYAWTDSLAVHFSHYYRSAYVLAYLLSAIAVLIALFGAFAKTIDQKAVLVAIELVIIFMIIGIVAVGRSRHWHERWIDYRLIAESLRHGRFLAYFSEFGGIHRDALGAQPWTIWYIRATLREIGLPRAVLDEKYQQPLLRATRKHEVEDQATWHRGNAVAMQKIDHFLHALGNRCFVVTAWTLGAYLAVYLAYLLTYSILDADPLNEIFPGRKVGGWVRHGLEVAKALLIILVAGLPTFGSALAAIRVHGDFEGSKERSQRMEVELTALMKEYDAAIDRPRLDKTADILIETARVMSEDLAAWQELYGRKRLVLPA